MKKITMIIAIMLVLCMVFCFVACKDKNQDNNNNNNQVEDNTNNNNNNDNPIMLVVGENPIDATTDGVVVSFAPETAGKYSIKALSNTATLVVSDGVNPEVATVTNGEAYEAELLLSSQLTITVKTSAADGEAVVVKVEKLANDGNNDEEPATMIGLGETAVETSYENPAKFVFCAEEGATYVFTANGEDACVSLTIDGNEDTTLLNGDSWEVELVKGYNVYITASTTKTEGTVNYVLNIEKKDSGEVNDGYVLIGTGTQNVEASYESPAKYMFCVAETGTYKFTTEGSAACVTLAFSELEEWGLYGDDSYVCELTLGDTVYISASSLVFEGTVDYTLTIELSDEPLPPEIEIWLSDGENPVTGTQAGVLGSYFTFVNGTFTFTVSNPNAYVMINTGVENVVLGGDTLSASFDLIWYTEVLCTFMVDGEADLDYVLTITVETNIETPDYQPLTVGTTEFTCNSWETLYYVLTAEESGTYTFTVNNASACLINLNNTIEYYTICEDMASSATFELIYGEQVWLTVAGSSEESTTFELTVNFESSELPPEVEVELNVGDNQVEGTQAGVLAAFYAPASGNYTFSIAEDSNAYILVKTFFVDEVLSNEQTYVALELLQGETVYLTLFGEGEESVNYVVTVTAETNDPTYDLEQYIRR